MRHLRWNGKPEIDFFKDEKFANFKSTLDAEMKRLQAQGVGSKRRQAEIITPEEEDLLWEKKLLGDHSPKALLDTVIFYNGLYFALRGGKEHKQLRMHPCQIQLVERPSERPFLKYTEDISKNHPGGLKSRKITSKTVIHHANQENPERCLVRLFKKYLQLCPTDVPPECFYLQPLKSPTATCWYSKLPLGHSNLDSTVRRLFKTAGVEGYKTNHSLRATATSRLYQAGVDEQLVMERTGHRSVEGVRSYKRTGEKQRKVLSDILNRQNSQSEQSLEVVSASPSLPSLPKLSAASLSGSAQTFNQCTVHFHAAPSATPCSKKRRPLVIDDSDSD